MSDQQQPALRPQVDDALGGRSMIEADSTPTCTLPSPRLGHVALVAQRPLELGRFYRDVFDLNLVRTLISPRSGTMVLLSGARHEEDHELVFASRLEAAHVALRLPTIATLRQLQHRLWIREVPVVAEVESGRALSLFIRDPEENVVEVYVATEGEPAPRRLPQGQTA